MLSATCHERPPHRKLNEQVLRSAAESGFGERAPMTASCQRRGL